MPDKNPFNRLLGGKGGGKREILSVVQVYSDFLYDFPFLLMELVLSRLFVIYFGCFLPRHVYKCVIWCGCHSLKHEISVNKKPPPHQLEHLKPLDMKTASCWTVGHVERRLQKTI